MFRAVFVLFGLASAVAAQTPSWNGYEKREFTVEGTRGYVVLPKTAAAGNPWLWRARFPDFHPDYAIALLSKGFHVAYYDLPNIFGSPEAVTKWDAFYKHVTGEFRLAPKMSLEGVSRGGLFVYNWARKNPDKVNAIYCESPVLDMKSWPGGKGKGLGSPRDWDQAARSYGFSEAQLLAHRENPLDLAAEIGAHRIPALHIVSEGDRVVPPLENTIPFAIRYRAAGGAITIHHNTSGPETSNGHHFPLDDPALPVNFILRHTPGMERLAGTGMTPHGVEYFKLRDGLRNSLARLSSGGEARVVFLGGSITNMNGWRDLTCEYLRKRFPKTKIDCINAGIPSTGSVPGAFRLTRDVFAKGPVDLLFEEAAVNDEANGFGPRDQVRGMEGIVRHARLINPAIDTVLLYFVNQPKMDDYRAGRTPEVIANHDKVAQRYALPSIDLAREVTERIDAGEFTWERDFKDVHPSPFGQTVYFRSIVRMLDAAWREPAVPGAVPRDYTLPAPVDPNSFHRGRLVDVSKASCNGGWRTDPSWKPSDKIATRPGFVDVPVLVNESGTGTCELRFEGTAVGIFSVSGPDVGPVEFSIDGSAFESRELFTKHSHRLHLPWSVVFSGDLAPGEHRLSIRPAGKAVRISHFLVNGGASE